MKILLDVLGQRESFETSHEYIVSNAQIPLPNHAASMVGNQVMQAYDEEQARQVTDPALRGH